ncbi:MAG TPA: lamin tail domain-containing protein [Candidatus Limnocylindria bacterium]
MSRFRPALAVLASITLLLVVLSTTVAVNEETAGPVMPAGAGGILEVAPIGHLLVSEVMTGGASASDELIELYNPSSSALPLEGLEVIYVTATGGTITRKASWAAGALSLSAGAHLLIANAAGAFAAIADLTYTNGLAATGGSVAIRIIGAATAIDAVGWGTAANPWMEGSAMVAPAAGASSERLPGGAAGSGQDTDQNAADFVERATPDPQNTASPPIPIPTPQPTASPTPADTPATTPIPTVEATAVPTATPAATPTPTPSATATPTVGAPTPSPTVPPEPMSIAEARALPDGASVLVEGVSLTDGGFSDGGGYLADATGGIAVLLDDGSFSRGMTLRVQGELDQRFSQRTIRTSVADVVVNGPATDPAATPATTGSIGEAFEGQLVELDGVVVSGQTALTSGIAVDLDDGSGPIRVLVGTATGIDVSGWMRGVRLHLRGVVGQRDSSGAGTAGYRVQPRDAADILALTPPATPSPSASGSESASPSPSGNPSVVSIATARAAAVNSRLTVRGVVTLPTGIGETGNAAIQDASGAILLRPADEAGSLRLGELVEVAGTRSTKAGMETIRVTVPPRKLGNQALPDALRKGTGALGEAQEAMLVVARGEVTLTPRHTSAENVYFDIDDGSGPLRVFVSPRAGIQTDTILLGSEVEVRGVLGQETTGKLPERGYRLWPRASGDLRIVSVAPGLTSGSGSGGGGAGQPGGPTGGSGDGSGSTGQAGSAGGSAKPARQQGVPRLEAPAPTAAIPSFIPGATEPTPASAEPADREPSPAPASAALLVLAGLLLGGGGVVAGPPGLPGRLWAALRQRLAGTDDGDEANPGGSLPGIGAPPHLVPLSVVEDAGERAGRILPPT